MADFVIIDGESTADLGIKVAHKINIPHPERRREAVEVKGRDGELHIDYGTYKPIKITIEFNYKSNKGEDWYLVFRKATQKFENCKTLKLPDDIECFYKCYYVTTSENTRGSKRIGSFTAEFVLDPFAYTELGQQSVTNPTALENMGYKAKPIYKLYGEGMCELNVNGKIVKINVGQNATLDVEKEIATKDDGTNINTTVSGDYENLVLEEGHNTISVTDGFILYLTPRWRFV